MAHTTMLETTTAADTHSSATVHSAALDVSTHGIRAASTTASSTSHGLATSWVSQRPADRLSCPTRTRKA